MSDLLNQIQSAHDLMEKNFKLQDKYLPLTIKKYPNEILKSVSTECPLGLQTYELADEMVKAMDREKGVGLAAVQVGINIRLIVVRLMNGGVIKMANPVIIQAKGKPVLKQEGCLSFPKATALVKRNTTIICEYFNLDTVSTVRRTFSHRDAQVIQHEVDHLMGVTIPDRLDKMMAGKFLQQVLKSNVDIFSEIMK